MRFNFFGCFQDWEITIAKKLVNDYVENWNCLSRNDYEYILWECLEHWHEVRGNYSSNRGASRQTYMGRIIRNKLQDIVRRQSADKREILQHVVRFEMKLGNDEDSPTLFDQQYLELAEDAPHDPVKAIDKRNEISKVMGMLTPRQTRICEMLMSEPTITEISKCLATPRSTIYDEIKRIRKIFEDAGLKDYLK